MKTEIKILTRPYLIKVYKDNVSVFGYTNKPANKKNVLQMPLQKNSLFIAFKVQFIEEPAGNTGVMAFTTEEDPSLLFYDYHVRSKDVFFHQYFTIISPISSSSSTIINIFNNEDFAYKLVK